MNRKIFASAITVLTGIFVYSSCTKVDSTDLGNDLIPVVDNVHTFETVLDVVTDNFLYPDSTRTNGGDLHALGLIGNDPEFGATTANMYTAFTYGSQKVHPFVNKDSVVIDSVVLSLGYVTAYGDTNSVQTVEVSQIDNSTPGNFNDTFTYKLDHPPFPEMGGVRGTRNFAIKDLNDSLMYVNNGTDTIKSNNQLRIKLDNSFADQFVDGDTTNMYINDSSFRSNFRGLAIKMSAASPTKAGLAYFNLQAENSRLTVYCRVTVNGQVDTISPYFQANPVYTANLIKKTPANNYLAYLNNGNPDDDKVYLQSSPGSFATIKIKGLDTFQAKNRVIHRAELIMEQIALPSNDTYGPVPLLFLNAVNELGDSSITIRSDFTYTGDGSNNYDVAGFGGVFQTNRYVFNLTRYMQTGVSKGYRLYKTLQVYAPFYTRPYLEQPNGTVLAIPPGAPSFNVNSPVGYGRVVLGGGSHPTQKMRVRIIYSKI
ncbi:DUF4270 family protein [Pseudoflavitalea rhizosphaerae]|uniref:DUF4270 family protein n=1 Tax=Pseudoflavitalea rhizosphaerae TaxID=1884793 RepID=UPI0013DEFADC|nr:DUF4270 family protein [Pseudoflavitalea rhizosphaerae]